MKTILTTLALSFSFLLYAGPGSNHSHGHSHDHGHSHSHSEKKMKPVSKEEAGLIGKQHVHRLIKNGKIDESWSKSLIGTTEQKTFGKQQEWVVTFDNEKGKKGKKLYIFLTLSGKFVAANFTGK
ncbi:MAG: hypothetical protein EP319_12615 [Deltaproteobacteria bacterium]|nr:MAG: hypothetical protein EP319_12615 [Deltaproteobacteria bacterium]